MYIPSYDFSLFKIPNFSSLGAQEFNAMTEFSANTPLSYVDYSLNQLAGLTQPNNAYPYMQRQFPIDIYPQELQAFFQDTPQAARERLRKLRDQANEVLGESSQDKVAIPKTKSEKTCPQGYSPVSVFGIFSYCGKDMISDGEGTMGVKEAPIPLKNLETFMNALPQGSGIFLIAVVVIILLFLFVRK